MQHDPETPPPSEPEEGGIAIEFGIVTTGLSIALVLTIAASQHGAASMLEFLGRSF